MRYARDVFNRCSGAIRLVLAAQAVAFLLFISFSSVAGSASADHLLSVACKSADAAHLGRKDGSEAPTSHGHYSHCCMRQAPLDEPPVVDFCASTIRLGADEWEKLDLFRSVPILKRGRLWPIQAPRAPPVA